MKLVVGLVVAVRLIVVRDVVVVVAVREGACLCLSLLWPYVQG